MLLTDSADVLMQDSLSLLVTNSISYKSKENSVGRVGCKISMSKVPETESGQWVIRIFRRFLSLAHHLGPNVFVT